jgi:hypothetical protein
VNRSEALAAFAGGLPEHHAVIAGVGGTSGSLWALGPSPAHVYNMEFSYPSAVALGLAVARPDLAVVSVEGEGSALAGAAGWFTLGRRGPRNLTVVVFDNGVFGTGPGTIPSAAGDGVEVAGVARAAGIEPSAVHEPGDLPTLRSLGEDVARTPQFRFIHVRVDRSDVQSGGRVQVGADFTEAAIVFQLHMRGVYPPAGDTGRRHGGPGGR